MAMMTDRPILFSGPMVRALLNGRKTQTRRVVMDAETTAKGPWTGPSRELEPGYWQVKSESYNAWKHVPVRFAVGDRLWVREAWRQGYAPASFSDGIVYRADASKALGMDEYSDRHRWKPGIHMFRRHSRLTLHVTDVRVQRLQDISEEDARAEGWEPESHMVPGDAHKWPVPPLMWYAGVWESLNGEGSWDTNPWVVAITFDVEKANIDQARPAA